MENDAPLISVLMGTFYRREELSPLNHSVSSILQQTYKNFEYLICDDGSTPAAKRVLEKYAAADMRIKLVRPGSALTLSEKLNVCLQVSMGSLIARMDDDDVSHPNRFSKQIAFLQQNPQIAYVGCNAALVCAGKMVGYRQLPQYPLAQDFYMTQPFIHPTLIFKRSALLSVNGYSERSEAILCEDYDLLLRLYKQGHFDANLQEYLFDYSVPDTARGNRKMAYRWNETLTRYARFRDLGLLPAAFPYVIKPLAVGVLPESILKRIKTRRIQHTKI